MPHDALVWDRPSVSVAAAISSSWRLLSASVLLRAALHAATHVSTIPTSFSADALMLIKRSSFPTRRPSRLSPAGGRTRRKLLCRSLFTLHIRSTSNSTLGCYIKARLSRPWQGAIKLPPQSSVHGASAKTRPTTSSSRSHAVSRVRSCNVPWLSRVSSTHISSSLAVHHAQ
jgi:hypothetical protein